MLSPEHGAELVSELPRALTSESAVSIQALTFNRTVMFKKTQLIHCHKNTYLSASQNSRREPTTSHKALEQAKERADCRCLALLVRCGEVFNQPVVKVASNERY